MSIKDFEQFLSRQRLPKEELPVDWDLQRREWLDFVALLYTNIEGFLRSFAEGGRISISYDNLTLTEENIGTYAVRRMTILLGLNRIVLTPIGTLLIGTKGRVDMTGPRGTKRFILADRDSQGMKFVVRIRNSSTPVVEEETKPINWEWKIVSNSAAPLYNTLTQDAFLNTLMEISNG